MTEMAQDDNEQNGSEADDGETGRQLDVQSIADYALEMVQEQAKSHPFRTVGLAMGVGYVLGGGVPKFVVRLGLLAAGRLMADAITAEGLRTLSSNLTGAGEDDAEPSHARTSRAKNGHHRKRANGEHPARRA
ncbi:MAG TPA: hypothetical protein VFG69_14410 [Nannocystaceae bacterium]|nr:hypothetical protein [Nannocystaceae bacterium]